MAIDIKSKPEIEKMRRTCRLAADVLDHVEPYVKPGVTTGELDRICYDFIVANGAYPSPLNYKGFPKSICTSINEVVCHGIPGDRVLVDGDIVNLDITTLLDGFHGDTSEMFFVGDVDESARKLVEVTRRAMWLGIQEVGPAKRIGDIGAAILEYAHTQHGYGVVEAFCGHGIG
nr:type I methionyl aminopeptidase [Nannocystaceae bacterium]